jgi:hypothetical protein
MLHVAAGKDGNHEYPDADFVVDVAASARFDQVLLTHSNTGRGDGFALELERQRARGAGQRRIA